MKTNVRRAEDLWDRWNRWDMKYPEHESASWQKLGDNAARFKKDLEIKNLILVRCREEVQVAEVTIENIPREEVNIVEQVVNNDEEEQVTVDVEVGEKLPKVTMSDEIQERANNILRLYLPRADTILEITNIVYAMGKAIGCNWNKTKRRK